EDFEVTNGPDLHVILSPVDSPNSSEELRAVDYVDLGELKGNVGNQNYEIPADVDIDSIGSVVIYCVPFHVIFATANVS
ncbi:MAG: DM13 domain-containing protein, partial [Acidimicrobiia bacterium]|nr:DM13 domain-containing protein [Acidimicrobiia bacterium]